VDAFVAVFVVMTILFLLGLAADRVGVDSRDEGWASVMTHRS